MICTIACGRFIVPRLKGMVGAKLENDAQATQLAALLARLAT
jgi:hypothetical protein